MGILRNKADKNYAFGKLSYVAHSQKSHVDGDDEHHLWFRLA
jgi:hypothetical protein